MISAKIRSAIRVLRLIAQDAQPIDGDTATALIHHLDAAAIDVARLEAHAVVRARPPLPISTREEALIGLVHCAVQQMPPLAAAQLLTRLRQVLHARPEVLS